MRDPGGRDRLRSDRRRDELAGVGQGHAVERVARGDLDVELRASPEQEAPDHPVPVPLARVGTGEIVLVAASTRVSIAVCVPNEGAEKTPLRIVDFLQNTGWKVGRLTTIRRRTCTLTIFPFPIFGSLL